MMFLLIEIIHQALLTINLPGQRLRREAPAEPRRLRQVILRFRVACLLPNRKFTGVGPGGAFMCFGRPLVGEQYYVGRQKAFPQRPYTDYRTSPIVRCDWDEATCTQLVYIYNEISRKFQGDAQLFCELVGREREFDGKSAPSVRVATIDIGGGTTDLSITTFELASDAGSTPRMSPHPDFRDGFSLAGDDILRAIIAEYVLDSVALPWKRREWEICGLPLASLLARTQWTVARKCLINASSLYGSLLCRARFVFFPCMKKTNLNRDNEIINLRIGDCFAFCTDEEIENDNKKVYLRVCRKEQFPMPGKKCWII